MTDNDPVTLWRNGLPDWLERTHVELLAGHGRDCTEPWWYDALIVIEHGAIVLRAANAGEVRLGEGAVFCVAHLKGATMRSADAGPALLCVGRRRRASTDPAGARR